MTLLEFSNIVKQFGDFKILNNMNFKIKEGDFIGLIGKSGEGKTTFLRVLIGFYKINSGKIYYKGKDITKNNQLSNIVGFCTQENSFYEGLTIEENLFYYGKLYGIKNNVLKSRIEELLKLVGLIEKRKTISGDMSGGMKRRLDFAIALLHNPKMLILDEPTTGLDPIIRQNIWDLIEKINKSGTTIIVSSHLLTFIQQKCKTIALLNKGEIKQLDMDEIKKKYPKKDLNEIFPKLVS